MAPKRNTSNVTASSPSTIVMTAARYSSLCSQPFAAPSSRTEQTAIGWTTAAMPIHCWMKPLQFADLSIAAMTVSPVTMTSTRSMTPRLRKFGSKVTARF